METEAREREKGLYTSLLLSLSSCASHLRDAFFGWGKKRKTERKGKGRQEWQTGIKKVVNAVYFSSLRRFFFQVWVFPKVFHLYFSLFKKKHACVFPKDFSLIFLGQWGINKAHSSSHTAVGWRQMQRQLTTHHVRFSCRSWNGFLPSFSYLLNLSTFCSGALPCTVPVVDRRYLPSPSRMTMTGLEIALNSISLFLLTWVGRRVKNRLLLRPR